MSQDDVEYIALRNVLRPRITQLRSVLGDQLLAELDLYQYYSDSERFFADFPTLESRRNFMNQLESETAVLRTLQKKLDNDAVPAFLDMVAKNDKPFPAK